MDRTSMRNKYAIVGVGYTPQGKVPGRSAASFYLEASMNAIKDAGLTKDDIDGLILYRDFPILKGDAYHITANVITKSLGIRPNFLSQEAYCYRTFLHKAIGAIEAGTAHYVLVVFAENGKNGHRTWTDEIDTFSDKPYDEYGAYGNISAFTNYSFFASRAMHEFGTGPEIWSEVAIAHRRWAALNPIAYLKDRPLTKEEYMEAPCLAWPFRAADATASTDGGRAIIITTTERAKEMKNPLVTIRGFGSFNDTSKGWQLTPGDPRSSAAVAGRMAFEMAGLTPKDIGAAQIYDCYTYTVEATLADYGFYDPHHSRDFLMADHIGPGGDFPVNTSGGLLAEGYYMGLTPVAEAVMQMSGRCGDRQLGVMPGTKLPEFMIVSDNGGYYNSNETMILERG
jgi:acetyl-CoA acetyltransferase